MLCQFFKKMTLRTEKITDLYHYFVHWEKLWKKIVHKHVFNFLSANNVITSLQSGFVPGDSTAIQLMCFQDFSDPRFLLIIL